MLLQEQSDLSLHCFLYAVLLKINFGVQNSRTFIVPMFRKNIHGLVLKMLQPLKFDNI